VKTIVELLLMYIILIKFHTTLLLPKLSNIANNNEMFDGIIKNRPSHRKT